MAEPSNLQPLRFKIARDPRRSDIPEWYDGYIVPDTDGLFAIDQRYDIDDGLPASWVITHVPSGMQLHKGHYTYAETAERAVQIAQAFYREAKALAWDLSNSNPREMGISHNALPTSEKLAFWERVCA